MHTGVLVPSARHHLGHARVSWIIQLHVLLATPVAQQHVNRHLLRLILEMVHIEATRTLGRIADQAREPFACACPNEVGIE